MPRFAEIEGSMDRGIVRYVLPAKLADDYPVLVQNQVEIPLDADVVQGDIYEAGKFRHITTAEIQAQARPGFDNQRNALFADTAWVRERAADLKELDRLNVRALTAADIAKYKEWLIYWQALRDMPAQPGFDPANPAWPTQPK